MVKVQVDGKDVLNNVNVIGKIALLDSSADPTVEGQVTLNGSTIKVYTNGKVVSLNDVQVTNITATAAPGVNDDVTGGYSAGSIWTDVTNDKSYVCLDATDGAAVWTEITVTGSVTEATQSDQEDKGTTNADRYVSPETFHHHASALKVFCKWEQRGTHSIQASENMTSVTDGGASGDTDLLYDVDFSGEYVISGSAKFVANNCVHCVKTQATTGCTILVGLATNFTAVDEECEISCFGDQ